MGPRCPPSESELSDRIAGPESPIPVWHSYAVALERRKGGPVSVGKPITILLAEDHCIMREGLTALLEADGAFTLVGQARTGREAVDLAKSLRPDVILMDIAMPVLNGLEATRQILAGNPAAKVLILSAHSDHEYIERVNAVGALGYMEKQMPKEMLTKAIREVAKGIPFVSQIGRA